MIDFALGPKSRLAEEAHLDLHLLSRVALGSHLRRAGVAQELLDRQLGERRIVPPDLRLLGVLEEGEHAARSPGRLEPRRRIRGQLRGHVATQDGIHFL
jgi:hypothetical protein